MDKATINSTIIKAGRLFPSAGSSPADFDFFTGSWIIHNTKLKTRLHNCHEWEEFDAACTCTKILNGFGNMDAFNADLNGLPFEAMTLRLFNPQTRLWSIYWADSRSVILDIPVVGSFEGNTGRFYANDVWEGVPIIMQFCWDKTNTETPTWSQAFSDDDGATWEWNWYMSFQRRG